MKPTHRCIMSTTRTLWSMFAMACMASIFLASSRPGHAKEIGPKHIIVTSVAGDITYVRSSESELPQAVTPFQKLAEGDTITLPLDAHMNVLFIARGLGETWQGPKTLLFQDGHLLAQIHGVWKREHPKLLKSLLFEPQKIMVDSVLLRILSQIGGTTRAIPVSREISKTETATIEKTYGILRKEFGDDDATPELYRLSVLAKYGQYDTMLPLLQNLLNSYPDNPILLGWQTWVESRSGQ